MNGTQNTPVAQFDPSMMFQQASQGYAQNVQHQVQSLRQKRIKQDKLFTQMIQVSDVEKIVAKKEAFQIQQANAVERAKQQTLALVKETKGNMTSAHVMAANNNFNQAQNIIDQLKSSQENWLADLELTNDTKYSLESRQAVIDWENSDDLIYPGNILKLRTKSILELGDDLRGQLNLNTRNGLTPYVNKNGYRVKKSYDDKFYMPDPNNPNKLVPKPDAINFAMENYLGTVENRVHVNKNLEKQYGLQVNPEDGSYFATKNTDGWNDLVRRTQNNAEELGGTWDVHKQVLWETIKPHAYKENISEPRDGSESGSKDLNVNLLKSSKLFDKTSTKWETDIYGVTVPDETLDLESGMVVLDAVNLSSGNPVKGRLELPRTARVTAVTTETKKEKNTGVTIPTGNANGVVMTYQTDVQAKTADGKRRWWNIRDQVTQTWEQMKNAGVVSGEEPSESQFVDGVYAPVPDKDAGTQQIWVPFKDNSGIKSMIDKKLNVNMKGNSQSGHMPL